MSTNLFGEKVKKEDNFEVIYEGPSFENRMELNVLHHQLESLERIIKKTTDILKETGKINFGSKDIKIFLKVEKGSFREILQVILTNPITYGVIVGCIVSIFTHFLNRRSKQDITFEKEVNILKEDNNFKLDVKEIVSPISIKGDQVNIIGDNNQVIIKQEQKEDFFRSLQGIEGSELLKNGEFEEELKGVVRKLDLDAFANNYLGFNIDDGPSKIPTSIRGEFNLNDVKEIINEYVKIKAIVRYKDDEIKHIEILHYEFLNKQEKLRL